MPEKTESSCWLYNRPSIYPADDSTQTLCDRCALSLGYCQGVEKSKMVESVGKLGIHQRQMRQRTSVFLILKDTGGLPQLKVEQSQKAKDCSGLAC